MHKYFQKYNKKAFFKYSLTRNKKYAVGREISIKIFINNICAKTQSTKYKL